MEKRGKIKLSIIILLTLVLFTLETESVMSESSNGNVFNNNYDEMLKVYNVKPAQKATVGSGGEINSTYARLRPKTVFESDEVRKLVVPNISEEIKQASFLTVNEEEIRELIRLNNIKAEAEGFKEPYIDSEILEAFETQTEARVIVKIRDTTGIHVTKEYAKEDWATLINFKKEFLDNKTEKILSKLSKTEFKLKTRFLLGNGFSGNITQADFEKLTKNPNVASIHLFKVLYIALDQSSPLINADDAENLGYTGAGRAVCVLDSGIDYDHPDLGGCFGAGCKVRLGWDYVNNDSDPDDDNGHGTNVAGIIASENLTYRGVAPSAKLIAMKVCDEVGSCDPDYIVQALQFCYYNSGTAYNISVVSISIGDGGEYDDNCTTPNYAEDEINDLHAIGTPVIVASGNNGHTNGISYPACAPNVTSVGAVYDANLGREPDSGVWSLANCFDSNAQTDDITCFTNRKDVNGAIRSGYSTLSAAGPTDDLNVASVNTVFLNTSGTSITVGGFVGGIKGQVLQVVKEAEGNNVRLEHNEGTANQNVFLTDGIDEDILADFGGWTLVCNGTSWLEVGR